MHKQIKSIIDTSCRAYPAVAIGFCAHGIASESARIYAAPQDGCAHERMHTIFNLSLAIAGIATAYFSPVISDLLNGTYYVSRYQADFYESNMRGSYHKIWKGFYIFGAAAGLGLAVSGMTTLPWAAFVTTRVAGRVLSIIETGLFVGMVAGAVRPTIKYLRHPFMPSITSAQSV